MKRFDERIAGCFFYVRAPDVCDPSDGPGEGKWHGLCSFIGSELLVSHRDGCSVGAGVEKRHREQSEEVDLTAGSAHWKRHLRTKKGF